MSMPLDGPRRGPASGGPAKSLVVLLHGYGASGDDLIELAPLFAERLPHTAFAAPHAGEVMPYPGMTAYQWFPLTELDPEALLQGTSRAAPALDAFLAEELKRYALPPSKLALVGFSQGCMMALHAGLRGPICPAAIVGLSGVVAGGSSLPDEIRSKPPVMLSHGSADDVIPSGALHLTREQIAAAGVPVEWHLREGLGHGIDEEVVALTGSFLRQWLR